MKKIYFFLFFLFTLIISAQQERKQIIGKITSDSISVEDVHIVNVTSRKGTVSNETGIFQMFIKENDTLLFSDIQFTTKKVIIKKKHIEKGFLDVKLEPYTNQLDEVVVDRTKITGGVNASTLNLPNAGKEPLNKLERNLNHYSQASLPLVILGTLLGQSGGIDNIYNIISGNRKKDQTLKKLREQDEIDAFNQEEVALIREHFTDSFFTETLNIPQDKITLFITSCIPKNIIPLFHQQRHLDITDIFIQESTSFTTKN